VPRTHFFFLLYSPMEQVMQDATIAD